MPKLNTGHQSSLIDLELLAEISQLLTAVNLDHVLERVIDLTARALGARHGSLILRDTDGGNWQRLVVIGQIAPQEPAVVAETVLERGLAGWVLRQGRGAVVYDTQSDERWLAFSDGTSTLRSALCLPVTLEDDILAIITLAHVEPNHFNEHHLRLLSIIVNQVAVAIRNSQLFERMQVQQRQLEATLHAIPDLLIVVDDAGQILLANDAAADFLGDVSPQDMVGQPLADVLASDSALAPLQDILANPAKHETTWTFEARSERTRRDCLVIASRWENLTGAAAGYVIVMHDVTTMRDLVRFKSEMLKMASHDLRSPLALIVGYCDLIRFDLPEDSPLNEYLDVIMRSTRRMNTLMDDLLKVEEIRSSASELHQPTDFAALVGAVADTLRMLADSKGQQVECDLRLEGMTPVTLDPVLIREALENLVANAVKYTPAHGKIRIESHYDERRVHVIVEDNGVGISDEELPHIFEWGFRAKHRTDNVTVDGLGLGLSLVKTVLERHGGDIWVESEEGVGSRFGLWLPR